MTNSLTGVGQRLKDWQYYPVDDLFNRPKAFKAKSTSLEFKPQ